MLELADVEVTQGVFVFAGFAGLVERDYRDLGLLWVLGVAFLIAGGPKARVL